MNKVCRDCGIEKPLEEFNRKSGGLLRSYCKPCDSARRKAWKERNPGRSKVTDHEWRMAHREQENARLRTYRRATGLRSDSRRRRALEAQGVTIVDRVERRVVFDRAGGRCQSCAVPLVFLGGPPWHVDHIIPVNPKAGGEHSYSNTQALCVPCHKAKTAKEQTKA